MIYRYPVLSTPEADIHYLAPMPSLQIIVAACMIFLIVNALISLSRRHAHKPKAIVALESSTPKPHRSLTCLVDKSHSILEDLRMLEKQLEISTYRCLKCATPMRLCRDRRLEVSTLGTKPSKTQQPQPSCEFLTFCDQLLLTNKIWKQERELKVLRAASDAKSRAFRSAAFTAFCDQLLLWNRIWKLEQQAAELTREKEKIRRERVAAVTRAAKRMVQDVQKERMVEEFVKDLIDEVDMTKAEIGSMKEKHEREVQEIQADWVKDYRKVRNELGRLKLAQSARFVEQELSNSMEERLFESIKEERMRVEQLEEGSRVVCYASSEETLTEAETSDARSELVSDLSSSTCVSSRVSSVRRSSTSVLDHMPERKRRISQGPPPAFRTSQPSQHTRSCSLPTASISTSNLEILAINQGKSVPAMGKSMASIIRTSYHPGRSLVVRNRATSVTAALRTPPASLASGSAFAKSGLLAKRAPWRI